MPWTTVLSAMLFLFPPRQNDVWSLRQDVIIAVTIARTCKNDTWCDSVLIAVSHFESGNRIDARGKLGEVGPWQLLAVSPYMPLSAQAREAWRRWQVQGPAGYTGEGHCPCPLAEHRRLEAAMVQSVLGVD